MGFLPSPQLCHLQNLLCDMATLWISSLPMPPPCLGYSKRDRWGDRWDCPNTERLWQFWMEICIVDISVDLCFILILSLVFCHCPKQVINYQLHWETQTQASSTYIFLGSPTLALVENSLHSDTSLYNRLSKIKCLYHLGRNTGTCLDVTTHFDRSQQF